MTTCVSCVTCACVLLFFACVIFLRLFLAHFLFCLRIFLTQDLACVACVWMETGLEWRRSVCKSGVPFSSPTFPLLCLPLLAAYDVAYRSFAKIRSPSVENKVFVLISFKNRIWNLFFFKYIGIQNRQETHGDVKAPAHVETWKHGMQLTWRYTGITTDSSHDTESADIILEFL